MQPVVHPLLQRELATLLTDRVELVERLVKRRRQHRAEVGEQRIALAPAAQAAIARHVQ